jgi:hypothetical protein
MDISEDVFFRGAARFSNMYPSPNCIKDAHVAADAGLQTNKMEHKHRKSYSQPLSAAASETKTLHVVIGTTGTVKAFKAGSITVCAGNATVTLDLKKNGTSILSAVITLNNANTARIAVAGTISSTTLAAGDWLEVVITATIGTGTLATGVFCELEIDEDAS